MNYRSILRFVLSLVNDWDLRRARCLGRLVTALMRARRLGVAAIGRCVPTATSDKHHIKSVDRFLGNEALDLKVLWTALLALASGPRRRLFVLLDWTDLDASHEVLVAAVSYGGRALPVAWTTSRKSQYFKSRNTLESSFCLLIKSLLPVGVQLVIVGDRGFARASLLRGLERARIQYVIRFRRDVHLIDARAHGPVGNRRIRRGQLRDLACAEFGDNARVRVRCVMTFGHGQGRNRPRQPWYLATNIGADEIDAAQVVAAYKLRMRIEHSFRDHKSLRFGFQLRSVRLTRSARYDRLLAIAAVALLLLVHVGAYAEQRGLHRSFKANTDPARTHSLFQLGLGLLARLHLDELRLPLLRRCFNSGLEGMS